MAWKDIPGWRPSFFSEIDDFPRAVLKHHYPDVPLHGDFTTIKAGEYEPIDLLVGGTPCQDFSIAGLRAGMDGERGNLTLEFLRLAQRLQPRWIVWENVPGVLSSGEGRDFGAFLGGLAELGYGWAYRCLDAQYAGLAQRRLRVFVIGYLGDWRRAAAVLFEPQSLRWDNQPRRTSRKEPAASAEKRFVGGIDVANPLGSNKTGGIRLDLDLDSYAIAATPSAAFGGNNTSGPIEVATAVRAKGGTGHGDFESETFIAQAFKASHFTRGKDGAPSDIAPPLSADADKGDQDTLIAFSCKDHGADAGELSPTLRAMNDVDGNANGGGQVAVCIHAFNAREDICPNDAVAGALASSLPQAQAVSLHENQRDELTCNDTAGTLGQGGGKPGHGYQATMQGAAARRLTPRECERLQGFPDDFTRIPVRFYSERKITKLRPADMWEPAEGGGWWLMAADGPRYRALGNSMAVPVMRALGERIAVMDDVIKGKKA